MHKPFARLADNYTPRVLSYAAPRKAGELPPAFEPRFTMSVTTAIALIFGIILMVGILLSSLSPRESHSRPQTPSQRCAYNMRQLFQVMRMYAHEHENAFPTRLGQFPQYLLKGGKGIPRPLFLCPASGAAINRSLSQAQIDTSLAGTASPDCSYVLDAPGVNANRLLPDTILAHELPTNHSDGTVRFAYGDGTIRILSKTQAAAELAKLQAGLNPLKPLPTTLPAK